MQVLLIEKRVTAPKFLTDPIMFPVYDAKIVSYSAGTLTNTRACR